MGERNMNTAQGAMAAVPGLNGLVESAASEGAQPHPPSTVRAWCFLVLLSWQRQARMRQMVWIAVSLLVFAAAFVTIQTAAKRWDMHNWRYGGRMGVSLAQIADAGELMALTAPRATGVPAVDLAFFGATQCVLDQSPFRVFTNGMILQVFLSFLLPIWTLSFATEALGGERESNSLIWLLSRPLPRPAMYLAKFVALLPWVLALNLGGFTLLCVLAGGPGHQALYLFWPVIFWTTVAFAALFHLIGTSLRRPAVIGILYVFFLEIILNLMPGFLKRFSISYYARCMMFDAGHNYGIWPENERVFMPVSGPTALAVLCGVTVCLLAVGSLLFTRMQYQDAV